MSLRFRLSLIVLCLGSLVSPNASAQFVQQGAKLIGTGGVGASQQGFSVALSADGNTAIAGAPRDDNNLGAAWIWTRINGLWIQQAKLTGSGASGAAAQGSSVAISADGNTAIIGGPQDNSFAGAAWIFVRSGAVWTQQGNKLVGADATSDGAGQGISVALSADGNTALVGGSADNTFAGAAWVWTRNGGVWTQQGGKLVGSGAVIAGAQGTSVGLSADGNTALVGGTFDNHNAGAAWVWTRSGSTWSQQGPKLVGAGASGAAEQGFSVALSGDGNTAVVGGVEDNSSRGAVWVWVRNGTSWAQQGSKLVGPDSIGASRQGDSVSISENGNTVIIGGPGDTGSAGAAWIWTRINGTLWIAQGAKLIGANAAGSSQQGSSVAISGEGKTVMIGAPFDNSRNGAAWIFSTFAAARRHAVAH